MICSVICSGGRLAASEVLAPPSRTTVLAFAGVLAGAVLGPWFAGWIPLDRMLVVSALVMAAMLASCLKEQGVASANPAIMPPAFVFVFSTLMLAGGPAAMCVAVAAALTPAFVLRRASRSRAIIDAVIVMP